MTASAAPAITRSGARAQSFESEAAVKAKPVPSSYRDVPRSISAASSIIVDCRVSCGDPFRSPRRSFRVRGRTSSSLACTRICCSRLMAAPRAYSAIVIASLCGSAWAATHTVSSASDLQSRVNGGVAAGDFIRINSGTYYLTAGALATVTRYYPLPLRPVSDFEQPARIPWSQLSWWMWQT